MSTTETKVRHTPGEWHVEPDGKVFMVTTGDGVHIKHIAQMLTKEDANVIAAAPDMLEALEDLVRAYDTDMGYSAVELRIKLAKDAIRKARGGAA